MLNIHNLVNEKGWSQIRQWELIRGCDNPKLVRFMGRPNDLSPKARFLIFLGYSRPFDRHDWIVDRDGSAMLKGRSSSSASAGASETEGEFEGDDEEMVSGRSVGSYPNNSSSSNSGGGGGAAPIGFQTTTKKL